MYYIFDEFDQLRLLIIENGTGPDSFERENEMIRIFFPPYYVQDPLQYTYTFNGKVCGLSTIGRASKGMYK